MTDLFMDILKPMQENQLSSLGLNNNTQLQNLYCQSNGITSLDLSQNTSLINIEAHENQLTYFDLRNGVSPYSVSLNATNNSELLVILTLEPASAYGAWTFDNGSIDEQVGFYFHFPPTTQSVEFSTNEDEPYEGAFAGFDEEGGDLTYLVIEDPANGIISDINNSDGSFVYTPFENYYGSDAFSYLVNDGTYNSNNSIISIYTPKKQLIMFFQSVSNKTLHQRFRLRLHLLYQALLHLSL